MRTLAFAAAFLAALAPSSSFANPKPAAAPVAKAPAPHAAPVSHSPAVGHTAPAAHLGAKSGLGAHPIAHSASGTHSLAHYDPAHPLAGGLHPGEIYHPRFAPGHDPYVHPAFYGRYDHPIYGYRRYDAWAWNHGVAWAPVGTYWGGGFWGPVALGVPFGAAITLGIDSPGYIVFQNYGLAQVPCVAGAGLVFVYGPSGSVICANPDAMVQAGNYNVDPATLELAPTTEE
jgi:hypothetical protein